MQQLLHPTKEVQKPWFLLAFFGYFLPLLAESYPSETIKAKNINDTFFAWEPISP